jgi:hypothetical protein
MPSAERFLSVRVWPVRKWQGATIGWLALELMDGAWCMYYLDEHQKILSHRFCADLDDALRHADSEFQIKPDDWTEDRSH